MNGSLRQLGVVIDRPRLKPSQSSQRSPNSHSICACVHAPKSSSLSGRPTPCESMRRHRCQQGRSFWTLRTAPSCAHLSSATASNRRGPKQCLQEGCRLLAVELIALRNGRMVLQGISRYRLIRLPAVATTNKGRSSEPGVQTKLCAHCIPKYGTVCPSFFPSTRPVEGGMGKEVILPEPFSPGRAPTGPP